MCVFTWEEVIDPHTMFLFSMNSERHPMKVYSVVFSITANIQQMPPDWLVLCDHQSRKCLCHVTIYC